MKGIYLYCSLLALCSLLLFTGAVSKRQINWVSVSDPTVSCSFSFPDTYTLNTQDDVRFYAVSADSVTFEVHFANTGGITNLANTNAQTNPDPYDQFVQVLAQVTQGQIISQSNIVVNSYPGRDAEVLFDNGINDQQTRMHVRFLWNNNRMYVFSAAATVNNDAALASARNTFFWSIQLQ